MGKSWRNAEQELPDVNRTQEERETAVVIAYDGRKTRALIYERKIWGGADVYRWLWIWGVPYDGDPVVAWRPIPDYDPED